MRSKDLEALPAVRLEPGLGVCLLLPVARLEPRLGIYPQAPVVAGKRRRTWRLIRLLWKQSISALSRLEF